MRHLIVLCSLLGSLALAGAGCGGRENSSAGGGPSAATVAPASALGYVTVNIDDESQQWRRTEELIGRFPDGARLWQRVVGELADDDLSWRDDVEPALGPEVALVLLRNESAAEDEVVTVLLTQPDDVDALERLLAKSDEPLVQREVDGWRAVADTQQHLDAFERAARGDKLADDETFAVAMSGLPEEALAKAFVNGAGLTSALAQGGRVPSLPAGARVEWLGAAAEAKDDGFGIQGTAKATGLGDVTSYEPTLLDRIPAGVVAAASFHGAPEVLDRPRGQGGPGSVGGLVQSLLGVSIEQLGDLFAGEGAFWVRPGLPLPEATLLSQVKDEAAARSALDALAQRLAERFGGRVGSDGAERFVAAGPVRVSYAVADGMLAVTTGASALATLRATPDQSLTDDDGFQQAKDAAGLSDRTSGFVYVDAPAAVGLVDSLARLAGNPLPEEVRANLGALRGFLAHTTKDGDIVRFRAFLGVG